MNQAITAPLCRWTFWMADENPGPAEGDAAELIESLGFNPWSFTRFKLIAEALHGRTVLSQFEVVGARDQVEALRAAHLKATGLFSQAPAWLDAP